MTDVVHAWQGE